MDIGQPRRIIEVEPVDLPLPETIPEPVQVPEPVPVPERPATERSRAFGRVQPPAPAH